jgi:hypothetical protein
LRRISDVSTAKPPQSEPQRPAAHLNATLVKLDFDAPERQREPVQQHEGQRDDLRGGVEIPDGAAPAHPAASSENLALLKLNRSDYTGATSISVEARQPQRNDSTFSDRP